MTPAEFVNFLTKKRECNVIPSDRWNYYKVSSKYGHCYIYMHHKVLFFDVAKDYCSRFLRVKEITEEEYDSYG